MRLTTLVPMTLLCLATAGCLSDSKSGDDTAGGSTTPQAGIDPFSKTVATMTTSDDDTTEPNDIEQIAQSSSDNDEPMPLAM